MRADVVIAGGGSAGLAAAVASARAGADTVLIERGGYLGGTATASLVHSICGLYKLGEAGRFEFANPGIPQEFAERLIQSGASDGPQRCGRLDVLPHHPTGFARCADSLLSETKNLRLLYQSEITSATAHDETWEIGWHCRGKRGSLIASAAVDTSGDAALCNLAGMKTLQAARLQRPAYVFTLGGIGSNALDPDRRIALAGALVAAVRDGRLPSAALGSTFRASGRPAEAYVTIDLDPEDEFEPDDPGSLGEIEKLGRDTAEALQRFAHAGHEGFENCFVASWPARAGVRESRRAVGDYQLTDDDLLSGARFDDAVALATWPMEMRENATGPKWRFPKDDRPCEIPLRSLSVAGTENVFVAGRCLSSEHGAQGAIRVIGTCLATGEAAGTAAARSLT